MTALLLCLALIFSGGILAFAANRRHGLSTAFGVIGLLSGSAIGLVPAVCGLIDGTPRLLHAAWSLPMASFSIGIDRLSAFFLIPVLLLSAVAGLYGVRYLEEWRGKRNLGACWFFYNALVAAIVLVIVARNAVLFLIAWETMALASYFLVMFDDDQEAVRRAGRTYLVATHIGTAALLVLFLLLGRHSATLDFELFVLGPSTGGMATAAFLLAVIGFGTKAGFVPLHVWLPEAHPASPSHVSALMSGVMIKTGIYGLIRVLTFLGAPPPAWWGWTLLIIGVLSGILGVLFALAQHDLKRLLAYHSVENIGIITIGLGLGLLGQSYGLPMMSLLGYGGALLHVVNHAFFKGLLFLGAGAVLQATHTREMDHLGGLLKRMPWTGACFLVGAAAISGLPPLNGFISEFLIFLAALYGVSGMGHSGATAGIVATGALALIGGLAAACFTKAFGIVFLGEPRSDHAAHAKEAGWLMRVPMAVLAAGCIAIGLLSPILAGTLTSVVASIGGSAVGALDSEVIAAILRRVVLSAGVFLLALLGLMIARRRLLSKRSMGTAPTWDCGYVAPNARMQYTSSGYAQPLTSLFRFVLRTNRESAPVEGLFPARASLSTHTPDPFYELIYRPAFGGVAMLLAKLRWLQGGLMQLYILYIALTLLILLLWKLG